MYVILFIRTHLAFCLQKVILGDRTLGVIFNSLGRMQSKPVDLVPSIDNRKEVTYEQ